MKLSFLWTCLHEFNIRNTRMNINDLIFCQLSFVYQLAVLIRIFKGKDLIFLTKNLMKYLLKVWHAYKNYNALGRDFYQFRFLHYGTTSLKKVWHFFTSLPFWMLQLESPHHCKMRTWKIFNAYLDRKKMSSFPLGRQGSLCFFMLKSMSHSIW